MSQRYARLRDLFDRCIDLPEHERERWIEATVDDADLRIELRLMIAADDGDEGFLERDLAEHIELLDDMREPEFDAEHLVGRRFGAFELRRLLGRGGQGAVYLADRVAGDFAQTAAVKLLRRGIHDGDEHRRFRREREILARFEHAGVARLIDGGVSGEGVPYLIMEYVEGIALDRWCDEQALDLRARVALFARLCAVVAVAHRALIVHRDLKPSNVLVTADGEIKVLDFGIARLLDEDDAGGQSLLPIMTPGYGAPEQARGGAITLATDVHALGMLLRVLLTGAPPPMFPAELSPLPPDLPRELGWIIDKATAMEAERRYRDAAELGDDVTRFLDARPVLAHPPSRWYVARKFLRRHRGGVLATVAVLLGVLASAGFALWQAKIAREQAQRAQAARDFLLGVFEAAQEDLPRDARPTPDVLARAAADRLDADATLAPAMRADFLSMLGAISYRASDAPGALAYQERALQALTEAGDHGSRDRLAIEVRRAWALSAAERSKEAAQALAPRLDELRAEEDDLAIEGIEAYADALVRNGRIPDALVLIRESVARAARIHDVDSVASLRRALVLGHTVSLAGDIQEAHDITDATLARWRVLGYPKRHAYAIALSDLAEFKRRLGDVDGAVTLQRETLALWRSIHPGASENTALTLSSLGRTLSERGDHDEAELLLKESAAMTGELFGPHHRHTINALGGLAALNINRQRYAEAADLLRLSATRCAEAMMDSQPRCITNLQQLSVALLRLGRLDEAALAMTRSLELRRRLAGEDSPDYAYALRGEGDVRSALGEYDVAMRRYDQALAIHQRAGTDAGVDAAALQASRSRTLLLLGRADEALAALDRAEALMAMHGRQPEGASCPRAGDACAHPGGAEARTGSARHRDRRTRAAIGEQGAGRRRTGTARRAGAVDRHT